MKHINNKLTLIKPTHLKYLFGLSAVAVIFSASLTLKFHPIRHISTIIFYFYLITSLVIIASLYIGKIEKQNKPLAKKILLFSAIFIVFTMAISPNSATSHPLFKTPLSGNVNARPALFVNVIDDVETLYMGTLELYLSVQSSRFADSGVRVIFPINVGEFNGLSNKYIQLPFEVEEGDELLFNLLDDDRLTESQENNILAGAESVGFVLVAGGTYYAPPIANLLKPAFSSTTDVLGKSIVAYFKENQFDNVGTALHIVESSRPNNPRNANTISLIAKGFVRNTVHANVKVYYPNHLLD
jgi:hypothetical protein